MVWRGKGRRKAVRALKEAKAGSEDDLPDTPDVEAKADSSGSEAKPSKPLTSAETKTESAKSKAKTKARSRTPLPKGRSSKRRDGGGRRGERDDDDRRDRGRVARPTSSPAPFIIAGAFVLGAIFIVAIVASKRDSRRPVRGDSSASSGGGHAYSSDPVSAGHSSSGAAAPARPRGGSAAVSIRAVHRGLSRAGDERGWTAACARCSTRVTSQVGTCPNSTCGAALRWDTRKQIKCEFCCPPDKLTVKDLNEIPENDRRGFCAFCGGSGKDPDYKAENSRLPFGMSRDGTGGRIKAGGCVICKGSGQCRKCTGYGHVDMPETFLP